MAGIGKTVVEDFPISKVFIPPERQRKDLGDLNSLADQIASAKGLIHPITIKESGELVAGERRLRAVRDVLRWDVIRAQIFERLPPIQARLIELIENISRKQLTWQEEVLAIADYHHERREYHAQLEGGAGYAGPWTELGTATDLGFSEDYVKRVFRVAAALRQNDQEVWGCTSFSGARNLISGRAERARAAAYVRGVEVVGGAAPTIMPPIVRAGASKEENTKAVMDALFNPAPPAPAPVVDEAELEAALAVQMEKERADPAILTGDFLEWADAYTGPKFDVLHVDFPYGKNYSGSRTRKSGKATFAPRYSDNPEVYWALVAGLLDLQDNICFEVAHCLFWFDLPFYQPTIDLFGEAGWTLAAPYPLVWTKSYEGVASDPRRRPRHCYETALLFSRGDRKLIRLDNDHCEAKGRSDPNKLHLNQKPFPVLNKFLSMLVDQNTAVLDPTCGSGMALRAAKELGSPRVLGVEVDPDSAEMARYTMVKPMEELVNVD